MLSLHYHTLFQKIQFPAGLCCSVEAVGVCALYFNVIFAQKMLIPSLTLDFQTEFLALAACAAQGRKETAQMGSSSPSMFI